jgi:hypothetical protein
MNPTVLSSYLHLVGGGNIAVCFKQELDHCPVIDLGVPTDVVLQGLEEKRVRDGFDYLLIDIFVQVGRGLLV